MQEVRVLFTSVHDDNLGTRGLWGKSTMYEETAGVPLILAGTEVPVGAVCDTPVTHVDAYPTIVEGVGIPLSEEEQAFPGISLLDIAQGSAPQRTVLSESHGLG